MRRTILVVEDSPTQREALRSDLADSDFNVEVAKNGAEALDAITCARAGTFDLVLSDVMMPVMDGYELCRRLKADRVHGELPFVLLTAESDPMAIVRGLECGADNYVTKPYDLRLLVTRLRNTLARFGGERESGRTSMGVNLRFLDTNFTITSGREQILDLFISSIEDIVRANEKLVASRAELLETNDRIEGISAQLVIQAMKTEDKYARLMQSAADGILLLDDDGRIVEANARAAILLEETGRLTGRLLTDLVAPADIDSVSQQLVKLRTTQVFSASDVELRRASGSSVFCDVSASRSGDNGKNLTLIILHDVTDRRAVAQGLMRSEAQLAEAQEIAGVGSFDWDLRTNAIEWSRQHYRIYGLDPATFTPHLSNVMEMILEDDRPLVHEAMAASIDEGQPFECYLRIRRTDGALRNIHAQGQLRRDEMRAPSAIVGAILDITDRKHLQEQLLQSQKMDAIGQLAGGIAHDFNNLLTVIHGNSDMALDGLDHSEPAREDIFEIKKAAMSAAALTRQLLAFSRKQAFQPVPIQLRPVAKGVATMLSRLIREDVEIVFDLADDGGWILADPGQMEQVLINLTVNARDAMPDGGQITIRTSTVVVASNGASGSLNLKPGSYEMLSVRDEGTGMDEATKARIFEPFFTTKPVGRGTGLGLSTVHGIVTQSGGHLNLTTELGKGTTMEIYFPHSDVQLAPELPSGQKRTGGGAETILLVEDEPSLRTLARKVLEKQGYSVLEAHNGERALAICVEHGSCVQLVVSDVVMPGMSARTMAEGIADRCPGVPVLFMSGHHDDDGLLRDVAGIYPAFLPKPYSAEELAEKVRTVLDSAGPTSLARE